MIALVVVLASFPASALAESPQDYVTNVTVGGVPLPNPKGPNIIHWFNTKNLDVSFEASQDTSDSAGDVIIGGFAYTLDHDPDTTLAWPGDPGTAPYTAYAPAEYSETVRNAVPVGQGFIDLAGWVPRQAAPYPSGFPGVRRDPAEGYWWLHAQSVAARWRYARPLDPSGEATSVIFGVDVTPPRDVQNMEPASIPVMASPIVTTSTVCDFIWDNPGQIPGGDYDELSGDNSWRVKLNGQVVRTFLNVFNYAKAGITIEDLKPGKNVIQVAACDYAGNIGDYTSTTVYLDPDTPTIKFTSPTGSRIGVKATITADATDLGGVKNVVFKLDGNTLGTDTSAPYSIRPNLSAYGPGNHTLSATVTDLYGRTKTTSKTVTIDRTPPSVTNISGAPNPFYPRKRDGYKDNLNVKFKLSENADVQLLVYTSSGTLWRTVKASRSAGSASVVWTGRSDSGTCRSGTFRYKIRATDSAGNTSTSSLRSVSIKFYQIVRLSNNSVKVIQR